VYVNVSLQPSQLTSHLVAPGKKADQHNQPNTSHTLPLSS
jgi:hypothetical protein